MEVGGSKLQAHHGQSKAVAGSSLTSCIYSGLPLGVGIAVALAVAVVPRFVMTCRGLPWHAMALSWPAMGTLPPQTQIVYITRTEITTTQRFISAWKRTSPCSAIIEVRIKRTTF